MTTSRDLIPAVQSMAGLLRGIPDAALGNATPCPDYVLGDLVDHVNGFALAFTAAARRQPLDPVARTPGTADRLGDDWRTRIPARLDELAAAWADPAAWEGTTGAAGVELPGHVAGLISLDELVVHGWDVARASGQAFSADPGDLEALHGFLSEFTKAPPRAGLFGPRVPVADGAPLLDQVVALTGRDPAWLPHT